MACEVANL